MKYSTLNFFPGSDTSYEAPLSFIRLDFSYTIHSHVQSPQKESDKHKVGLVFMGWEPEVLQGPLSIGRSTTIIYTMNANYMN